MEALFSLADKLVLTLFINISSFRALLVFCWLCVQISVCMSKSGLESRKSNMAEESHGKLGLGVD